MRLFTALWPPPEVLDALAGAAVRRRGLRPVPRERWHVTLAFHGEDDPLRRAAALDERLAGAVAPRLRLAGTGSFPGVLWAGVHPAGPGDAAALDALVVGAVGDPGRFVGHLTLARGRGRPDGVAPPELPPGPWWTPGEVALVASGPDGDGVRYRTVHRVRLAPRPG